MLWRTLVTIAIVAMLGAPTPAVADDLLPPTWRGGPLSIYAEWEWATLPPNFGFMPPDVWTPVSGTADPNVGPNGEKMYAGFSTHSETGGTGGWVWTPGDGDGGITPTLPGAGLAFNVQNWVSQEPHKLLWIQVTYQTTGPTPSIQSLFGVYEPAGNQVNGIPRGGTMQPGYFQEEWLIQPAPHWEQFALDVPMGVVIDQVVLDTITFPCRGDIDGDLDIDLSDLAGLLAAFGSEVGDLNYNAAADLDDDGDVDLGDLAGLLSVFGSECP